MILQFINFYRNDDNIATLEVFAFNVIDVDTIVNELFQRGFTFESIDNDSIKAKLEGTYEDVVAVMQELKNVGFTWNDLGINSLKNT